MRRERKGYRLFRATFKDRDGRQREAPKWTAEFRDALETTRRLTFYTSKSASAEAARTLVRLVEDAQASGGVATSPELLRWVSTQPQRVRRQKVC